MRMSVRIRDRAIRRAGEILKQIESAKNQHDAESRAGDGAGTSRKDAAVEAGMSKRQQVTAIRVANVPARAFEAAVEAAKPATVTQLSAVLPTASVELSEALSIGPRNQSKSPDLSITTTIRQKGIRKIYMIVIYREFEKAFVFSGIRK